MINQYEPYTNFYEGQLGWIVQFGSGNLTSHHTNSTNYGVTAILGGEIMTTSGGTNYPAPVLKELLGRRLWFGNVASRESMMNSNPALINELDRAIINLILTNQKGRFVTDEETYSLEFVTSEDPRGNPVYQNMPGNKPHCKMHFNHKLYKEQLQQKQ